MTALTMEEKPNSKKNHLPHTPEFQTMISRLDQAVFVVEDQNGIALMPDFSEHQKLLAVLPPALPETLGSPKFKQFHHVHYAYMAGSMAHGIASEEMVIALAKKGFLASFGSAGLPPARVEKAIHTIKQALPHGPYVFNLINAGPVIETACVDLYLKEKITTVEASAYLHITPGLVFYRAKGLKRLPNGEILIQNKMIAKLSRPELAEHFASPAPKKIIRHLLESQRIAPEQAELLEQVPMADDITVEADSGGHTDNRPLVCILPLIRDTVRKIETKHSYPYKIRIGAAGGIGTPYSVLAAFHLGADYVVTGSVNQSSVEAGTSAAVKQMLSKAGIADVAMAPAADMFEMGVKVQVLKGRSLFASRAQKLYDIYTRFEAWEQVPENDKTQIETTLFKQTFESVWDRTKQYFEKIDPRQIELGEQNPKKKMALVFRWYLGLASSWAKKGEEGREPDYQIWCGPALGAFNAWVQDTALALPQNRFAAVIAEQLLQGACYLNRLHTLKGLGIHPHAFYESLRPLKNAGGDDGI